eukprot:Mrub_10510.p1 GENE.Mrub_10510~~Mrub_10510.p1  ORF type:complete len:210 (-),score=41.76 Mrub_10510:45-644(-)
MPKKVNEENPLIEDNGEFAPDIRRKLKLAKKLTQGYTDRQNYLCVEEFKGNIQVLIRGTYIAKKDEKRHFTNQGINLNIQEYNALDEIIKNLEVNTCLENLDNEKIKSNTSDHNNSINNNSINNLQKKKRSNKINLLKYTEFRDKYEDQIQDRRTQINKPEANLDEMVEIWEKYKIWVMDQDDATVEYDINIHLDEMEE